MGVALSTNAIHILVRVSVRTDELRVVIISAISLRLMGVGVLPVPRNGLLGTRLGVRGTLRGTCGPGLRGAGIRLTSLLRSGTPARLSGRRRSTSSGDRLAPRLRRLRRLSALHARRLPLADGTLAGLSRGMGPLAAARGALSALILLLALLRRSGMARRIPPRALGAILRIPVEIGRHVSNLRKSLSKLGSYYAHRNTIVV